MTDREIERDSLHAMLEPRRVALVGASPRPGSFGERMVIETRKSSAPIEFFLVNPNYDEVLGSPCLGSLDEIEGRLDLALLGVRDDRLEEAIEQLAKRGDRAAVAFGNAYEAPVIDQPSLRERITATCCGAEITLCGAGCMGFINVARGVRAAGYLEPDAIPIGPVALVSHSGSVFSAMLRTRRRLGFSLVVSSGQELVTTAGEYIEYALELEETRVIALVLETMRDAAFLRTSLEHAAGRGVDVVALTVGSSASGRPFVSAHSGALAGSDAAWEALFDAYGVHRVADLEELADTIELFSSPRRPPDGPGKGLATVHDSGAERVLVADVAERIGVDFASIAPETTARLEAILDPGLQPTNPLDVWGTGADTARVFGDALAILAEDQDVGALALAVDLVHEYDGDDSYVDAVLAARRSTDKPVVVLSNMASTLDPASADRLREAGVPVLEGTRSGLGALGHLLEDRPAERADVGAETDEDRSRRVRAEFEALRSLGSGNTSIVGVDALAIVGRYGIRTAKGLGAGTRSDAIAAAQTIGYPVVLKTASADVLHKSDAGGVRLGVVGPDAVASAYDELEARFGPLVSVSETVNGSVELALGIVHDPSLGALVVVGSGGELVEYFADRVVALPPISHQHAGAMLDRLKVRPLLDGFRGRPPCDVGAIETALVWLSQLALELGDAIDALDINPLICGHSGAVAVDALIELRQP